MNSELSFEPIGILAGLGAALAIGLLIGLERGWSDRNLKEGQRVAGLRTFALTGLLGGILAQGDIFGDWLLPTGLLAVTILLAMSYREVARAAQDLSITTAIAMLLTLTLGAMAASGRIGVAFAGAVIVTLLLSQKQTMHGWLQLIEHRELSAGLQLLVLSVVILPILPNTGLGPFDAINPRELWIAVIAISALSLSGHIAMRFSNAQRGVLLTGLLGGLASSTAATLALARLAKQQPALAQACAAGTIAASSIMFFRMTVLLAALQPRLLTTLAAPLLVAGSILLLIALGLWRRLETHAPSEEEAIKPMAPFELGTALGFGAFLTVMAVLVPAARELLGNAGLYVLSAVSGLADVDAVLISVARASASTDLTLRSAALAIGLAALANMVVKGGMAWVTGGAQIGRTVAISFLLSLLAGAAVIALMG